MEAQIEDDRSGRRPQELITADVNALANSLGVELADKTYIPHDERRTSFQSSVLEEGALAWNSWREANPNEYIDLRGVSFVGKKLELEGVNLRKANLHSVNFGGANLRRSNFSAAYLYGVTLQSAKLAQSTFSGAYLSEADLNVADLTGCDLRCADLSWAGLMVANLSASDLQHANLQAAYCYGTDFNRAKMIGARLDDAVLKEAELSFANLAGASLAGTSLVEANLTGAILDGSRVYGASVWKTKLEQTSQRELIITPEGESKITADNLKVAQFLYLMINNAEFREILDTVTSKVVLILGRFTVERKVVLDALKAELGANGYIAVIFDFEGPTRREIQETVSTLAHMARFIVADISDPRSIPQELISIVPTLPSVPVQTIIKRGEKPWGMYELIARYPWVLKTFEYDDVAQLLEMFRAKLVIDLEAACLRTRHT